MITDHLIAWVTGAMAWLVDTIPVPPQFPAAVTAANGVATVAAWVATLHEWVPLGLIGSLMVGYVGCWLIAGGIVLGRMALSLFTGGGGSVHVT